MIESEVHLKCSCQDCEALRTFLHSPTQAWWEFKASKPRREHLTEQLERSKSDVRCHTIAKGSPHLLLCEKTTASYLARCQQREADLRAVETLAGIGG